MTDHPNLSAADTLKPRLDIEATHVSAIAVGLNISREAAAIYSMLWNIESALAPTQDEEREPWQK